MVYKKYGSTFRMLREQAQLPLSAFSSLNISRAALSKFERGESMMSFEKVASALQIIGVSLEEFEYFLNDYSGNESECLLKEIENATVKNDTATLEKLVITAEDNDFPYIALAAKSSLSHLSSIEVDKITDHLYEIEVWSYKELCIFYFAMDNISTKDILYVLDLFLAKGHKLFNSEKYRSYLVQAACRAITILSYRGYQEYARYVLNRIDLYKLINTMFLQNLRNLSQGYWTYCFDDIQKGDKLMKKALQIFQDVSTPEIAQYYQKRYNLFVKGDIDKQ